MPAERRRRGSQRPSSRGAQSTPTEARGASSRDAFVDTTGRLLRRQGYAGTGLNEIVALSGAPKGSLYFHFPGGKEQLAIAAMDRAGEQLRAAVASILFSTEDLGEALTRLLEALAAGLKRSAYRDGCPIATVTLEAASDSEAVRVSAEAALGSWLGVIEERLLASGMDRERAARRSVLVLAAIEGALILARARRDLAPIAGVRDELVELSRPRS